MVFIVKEVKTEYPVCSVGLRMSLETIAGNMRGPAEIYQAEPRMDFVPLEGAPLNWPALHQNITLVDGIVHISAQMQALQ